MNCAHPFHAHRSSPAARIQVTSQQRLRVRYLPIACAAQLPDMKAQLSQKLYSPFIQGWLRIDYIDAYRHVNGPGCWNAR